MILLDTPLAKPKTAAELLERLGGISPSRVLLDPPPGHATVEDVIAAHDRDNRLCELVDGTLVEKPMGYGESFIAGTVLMALRLFVDPRNTPLHEADELSGGDVLHGFTLPVRTLFVHLDRHS